MGELIGLKQFILGNVVREIEIRPKELFNTYLKLARQDAKTYFSDAACEYCTCPACGEKGEFAFNKNGFEYVICSSCETLYVSPRPIAEAFSRYYIESPSAEFWATDFYKETSEARREKLWKPKALNINDMLIRYNASAHSVIDIGGGYGIFAEEMSQITGQKVTVIEPSPHLAQICKEKDLKVIEKFLEQVTESDLPKGSRAFVSFELFEHLHDPKGFLNCLSQLMKSGDLFIFTTLSGTGVDIQALWEDSKSVSPPHHLNFFNPHSIKILLEHIGLEALDITTPGKLDIDILVNNHAKIKDRFWKTFVSRTDQNTKDEWQVLISNSGWSSHMMVSCRQI
jgi:2-polyprenyl-3-methyl-5-hydroxy-6-metoxy-1,4-benzoquinol methylase